MNERIHTESDRVRQSKKRKITQNSKLPPQAKRKKHVFIQ